MPMQYQNKREPGEANAGMYEYHGRTWGKEDDTAIYDFDKVREVSAFESAAFEFEDKLGAWAFNEALPYAENLSVKVVDYLTVKHLEADAMAQQLDARLNALKEQLPQLAVDPKYAPTYAGAVGNNFDDIKDVLTDGNLRERLVVVESFTKNVLKTDVLDDNGAMEEILAKAEQANMDIEASLVQGDFGEWTTPWETGHHNEEQTVVGTGYSFRAKSGNLDQQPVGEGNAIGRETAGTVLPEESERGVGKAVGKYEGKFQQANGAVAGSEVEGETMKWANPTADMIMNEADDWVKKQREVGMPLRGGPSGHTHKFMMVNQILGMPNTADEMRLACIGHLLPIKAHSFIEVMEAAKALGASPYPNSQRIYRHLAPYGDSLAGLVGDSFPDTVLTKEELVEAGLVKPNELDMGLVPESQQTKVAQDSAASLERMNGASANDAA